MIWGHTSLALLSQMVDGMLDPKVLAQVKRHLASCPRCAQTQSALTRVKSTLSSLPALEERFLQEPSLPVWKERISHSLSWQMILAGSLLGLALLLSLVIRPAAPVLRVISGTGSYQAMSSEGLLGAAVKPEESVRTLSFGSVDLEVPHQILLRLKPGTVITWQEKNRFWFVRPAHVTVNLLRGEMLARTQEGFWGSRLDVRTPTASATVKGTAFSLKVDSEQDTTTLKVLAGSVFFSPHLRGVGVDVDSGKSSRIKADRLPSLPQTLSLQERKSLLETYRIGQDPPAAVVVGGGPERLLELFEPALLYVSFKEHPQIQPFLRKVVHELNTAILEGNAAQQKSTVRVLEMSLEQMTEQEVAVPFLLFAGAYASQVGEPLRAQDHFRRVVEKFPAHPQASLALAAIGWITEKQFKAPDVAQESYQKLLKNYPHSPEAVFIRQVGRDSSS